MILPDEVETMEVEETIEYKNLLRQVEKELDTFLKKKWEKGEKYRSLTVNKNVKIDDFKKIIYAYRKNGWICRPLHVSGNQLIFEHPRKKCGVISKRLFYWMLLPM